MPRFTRTTSADAVRPITGKGDKPRPYKVKAYHAGYDNIAWDHSKLGSAVSIVPSRAKRA